MERMYGIAAITSVCILVILIGVLKKNAEVLLNFAARTVVCFLCSHFLNSFFLARGLDVAVGINLISFLTYVFETFRPVLMNCFDHFALGKLHAPYLGEGVQLVPLNGQNRLEVQHRRQRGRGGRDPAALFQVLHGIHGDVDAGIIGVLFQEVPDLSRVIPLLHQTKGADDRLLLGDGDAVIIHHGKCDSSDYLFL